MAPLRLDPWTRRPAAVGGGAFVLAWAVLALAAPDGLDGGDAAVYQQQIERGDFGERTVHLAYYLAVKALVGFTDEMSDVAMNRASAVFAAGVVGLLAAAATRFGAAAGRDGRVVGAATALVLLGNWTFVRQGLFAEVYGAQAFFVVLALFLWWRRLPGSGVAFGVAALVTPSSVLASGAFPALDARPRRLALFAVTAAATLGLALAFVWRDFFLGDRGLLRAAGSAGLDWRTAVLKEGFEVVYGAFALLPFLLAGVAALLEGGRRRWALALLTLWAPTFALGERFRDVPVQLPLWTLLAPVTVLGIGALGARLEGLPTGGRVALSAVALATALAPIALLPRLGGVVQSFADLPLWLPLACAALVAAGAALSAALSLTRAEPRRAVVALAGGALAANLVFVGALATERSREVEGYKRAVLAIDRRSTPGWIAVGGWSRGILLEHYLWSVSYTGRWVHGAWLDGAWGEDDRAVAHRRLDEAVRAGHDIWLLDADDATDRLRLEERGYVVEPALRELAPGIARATPAVGSALEDAR